MAYLHSGPKPDGGSFYNVEQAVGATGANATGDVKLVQYMLANLYGTAAAGLKVDGWIGPVTIGWIKRFQTDAKTGGANVLVDGRIDRALAQLSSVSKTTYAVLLLNWALRQKNAAAYARLPQAVPLSAVPRANPYNPRPAASDTTTPRVVVSRHYKVGEAGLTMIVVYEDGSTETWRVTGEFRRSTAAYGRVVAEYRVGNVLYRLYESGYQETLQLPPNYRVS